MTITLNSVKEKIRELAEKYPKNVYTKSSNKEADLYDIDFALFSGDNSEYPKCCCLVGRH